MNSVSHRPKRFPGRWGEILHSALFSLSILGASGCAFLHFAGFSCTLPASVEIALWLHFFFYLLRSLFQPGSPSSSQAAELPPASPLQEGSTLLVGLTLLLLLRWPVLFSTSALEAQSHSAALLSATQWGGLPWLTLFLGFGWFAVSASAARVSVLCTVQLAPRSPSWLRLLVHRTVLLSVLFSGLATLLGYATGSWHLFPE